MTTTPKYPGSIPGSFAKDRSIDSLVLRVMMPIGTPLRWRYSTNSVAPAFSRVCSAASTSMASKDCFLGPPLLGVLHPGKELEQPQTGRTSDRAPQGGEIEGVGDGERPVEVEEHGRDPERSNQRKHLLLRSGGRFSVPSA